MPEPITKPYDFNITLRLRWQLSYYRALRLMNETLDGKPEAIRLLAWLEKPR